MCARHRDSEKQLYCALVFFCVSLKTLYKCDLSRTTVLKANILDNSIHCSRQSTLWRVFQGCAHSFYIECNLPDISVTV